MTAFEYINELSRTIHDQNKDVGWWDNRDVTDPMVVAGLIALMHSELSEALEGVRKDLMDDHLPHRKMVEVEFADTIIRILDVSGALRLDIGGAITEKLEYNRTRIDHQRESRGQKNGKSI